MRTETLVAPGRQLSLSDIEFAWPPETFRSCPPRLAAAQLKVHHAGQVTGMQSIPHLKALTAKTQVLQADAA